MEHPEILQIALSPQDQLSEMIWGFTKAQLVYVAAKLAIADLLWDNPKDAHTLSTSTKIAPEILYRLMRGLAWCGLVEHLSDDRFSLTPVGECLYTESPNSLYENALSMGEIDWPVWSTLFNVIQTGKPGFERAFGMEIFDYFAQNEEVGSRFDRLMGKVSEAVSTSITNNYDFSSVKSFVDIGGGNGTLAAAILQANPHLRGIIFDLPDVIERTNQRLQALDIANQCETIGGDFFKSVPPGVDAYIMKWILHDWPDDHCIEILKNCHAVMEKDARLLVVDMVMPEQASPSTQAVMYDLHMLAMVDGIERTETEFYKLFSKAGFNLNLVIHTESGMSIIEGVPM
jgi:ubiquinone/menaquinone biosynthesis C-methylase UbiE